MHTDFLSEKDVYRFKNSKVKTNKTYSYISDKQIHAADP